MTLDEKIQREAQKLPHAFQQELLDFVEYLLKKAEHQDDAEWDSFSLASAVRGLDDDVAYSTSDIKENFA